MLKAYISAPYTSKTIRTRNPSHEEIEDTSYINILEMIDSIVKACGFTTFLPHRDLHEWGKRTLSPEEVCKKSLKELISTDVLVVYPERSAGANIEIGWASLLKKKVVILINERDKVSIMQEGLSGITSSKIIKFRDIIDLKNKLRQHLLNLSF